MAWGRVVNRGRRGNFHPISRSPAEPGRVGDDLFPVHSPFPAWPTFGYSTTLLISGYLLQSYWVVQGRRGNHPNTSHTINYDAPNRHHSRWRAPGLPLEPLGSHFAKQTRSKGAWRCGPVQVCLDVCLEVGRGPGVGWGGLGLLPMIRCFFDISENCQITKCLPLKFLFHTIIRWDRQQKRGLCLACRDPQLWVLHA